MEIQWWLLAWKDGLALTFECWDFPVLGHCGFSKPRRCECPNNYHHCELLGVWGMHLGMGICLGLGQWVFPVLGLAALGHAWLLAGWLGVIVLGTAVSLGWE